MSAPAVEEKTPLTVEQAEEVKATGCEPKPDECGCCDKDAESKPECTGGGEGAGHMESAEPPTGPSTDEA